MYGATIGSLNVYFKLENEKTPRLMWSMSGNQGNQWKRGLFDLPPANTSFQVLEKKKKKFTTQVYISL